MSITYTVQNWWELGENEGEGEPPFGDTPSFDIGNLSFKTEQEQEFTKADDLELDAVECLFVDDDSCNNVFSQQMLNCPEVVTPSKYVIAENRCKHYDSKVESQKSNNTHMNQYFPHLVTQSNQFVPQIAIPQQNFNVVPKFTSSELLNTPPYYTGTNKPPSIPQNLNYQNTNFYHTPPSHCSSFNVNTCQQAQNIGTVNLDPFNFIDTANIPYFGNGIPNMKGNTPMPHYNQKPSVFGDFAKPNFTANTNNIAQWVEPKLPSPSQVTSVGDFEEQLVELDYKNFETYISQVSQYRTLQNTEIDLIKQMQRRIKNREGAKRLRQEKKNKMNSLEHDVLSLRAELNNMRHQVETLQKNNSMLSQELSFCKRFIDSYPVFSKMFNEAKRAFMSTFMAPDGDSK